MDPDFEVLESTANMYLDLQLCYCQFPQVQFGREIPTTENPGLRKLETCLYLGEIHPIKIWGNSDIENWARLSGFETVKGILRARQAMIPGLETLTLQREL